MYRTGILTIEGATNSGFFNFMLTELSEVSQDPTVITPELSAGMSTDSFKLSEGAEILLPLMVRRKRSSLLQRELFAFIFTKYWPGVNLVSRISLGYLEVFSEALRP